MSFASIVSTTGQVNVIPAPANAGPNALTSDTADQVFLEGVTLLLNPFAVDASGPGTYDSNASLNGGTIPGGTLVASYMFHADSLTSGGGGHEYIGSVTFSSPILGVISTNKQNGTKRLDTTDPIVGHPGTTYDTGDNARDLELGIPTDSFVLSADLRTVSFDVHVAGNMDEFRVLTAAPEPGTIGLMLFGVAGLAAIRRRIA